MTVKHLFPAVEPSLNLDFANSKKLDPRITFTRSSTGTYVDSNGLIKTAAANEARFDHDLVSGSSLGLLMEPTRTNYAKSSENISLVSNWSGWAGGEFVVTPNATTAPDGTSTATLIKDVATSGNRSIKNTSMSSLPSSVYTVSCFFKKAGNGNTVSIFYNNSPYDGIYDFNLDSPSSLHQNYSIAYPNGWYRVFFTTISARTNMSSVSINAGSSNGTTNAEVYMWGFQVEQNILCTSYIPTSATTVTRTTDLADMTGTNFSSWYNQSEGSFHINAKPLYPFQQYIFRTRLTNTIGIGAYFGGNDARSSLYVTGGSGIVNLNLASNIQNFAAAYKDYDFAVAGPNQILTNTTQTLPPYSMTSAEIGRSGLSQNLYGHIARIAYYPTRLTNAQLQALTL